VVSRRGAEARRGIGWLVGTLAPPPSEGRVPSPGAIHAPPREGTRPTTHDTEGRVSSPGAIHAPPREGTRPTTPHVRPGGDCICGAIALQMQCGGLGRGEGVLGGVFCKWLQYRWLIDLIRDLAGSVSGLRMGWHEFEEHRPSDRLGLHRHRRLRPDSGSGPVQCPAVRPSRSPAM
jgi:hypothetical protein